jgi:hypothetical protein
MKGRKTMKSDREKDYIYRVEERKTMKSGG